MKIPLAAARACSARRQVPKTGASGRPKDPNSGSLQRRRARPRQPGGGFTTSWACRGCRWPCPVTLRNAPRNALAEASDCSMPLARLARGPRPAHRQRYRRFGRKHTESGRQRPSGGGPPVRRICARPRGWEEGATPPGSDGPGSHPPVPQPGGSTTTSRRFNPRPSPKLLSRGLLYAPRGEKFRSNLNFLFFRMRHAQNKSAVLPSGRRVDRGGDISTMPPLREERYCAIDLRKMAKKEG